MFVLAPVAAAVRGLDKLGRQAHTVIEVQFGPGVDTLRLPRVVEIALYRVAQEAVTNALRHAQPSYLCVTMEHSACGTSLRVTDNGNGFSPAQVTTGLGLTVMREHILAVGGTLQITSEPGETVVTDGQLRLAPGTAVSFKNE